MDKKRERPKPFPGCFAFCPAVLAGAAPHLLGLHEGGFFLDLDVGIVFRLDDEVDGVGALLARIRAGMRVAAAESAVLILGATGTGKELVAQTLHEASPRRHGPFVAVDCAGLTETLFESELFGYEKGAFTGANFRKLGLVEAASGGTLFLDEIGELPLTLQVKLLRLLESGTYRRVGGLDSLRADFRLVAATHRDLPAMVQAGSFRQDLFYRLNVFPLRTPSLAERREDIPMISPDQALKEAETESDALAARAYLNYAETLKAYQAVDFDDLILLPAQLFEENREVREKWQSRLRYLLVDEYQDTNACQYKLLKLMAIPL